MLSKTSGRPISDEARELSIGIILRARNQRWNWLTRILRMGERRTVRQVLMLCVTPTTESRFGDIPDLIIDKALKLQRIRQNGKL